MERNITVSPEVAAFAEQLLGAGGFLADLVDGLAKSLGQSGDHDDPEAEVLAMFVGTVAHRLSKVPDEDFAAATRLLEQTLDVVLEDLGRAIEIGQRRERCRARKRRSRRGPLGPL
jgi:hypothetical protein